MAKVAGDLDLRDENISDSRENRRIQHHRKTEDSNITTSSSLSVPERLNIDEKDVQRPTENDVKHFDQEAGVHVHYAESNSPVSQKRRSSTLNDLNPSIPLADTTDDDDEIDEDDEYDWSGDEDIADEQAAYEKQIGSGSTTSKKWNLRRIVTFFFSTLVGSTLLAGLLVLGPILLKVFWLDPHRNSHRQFIWDQVAAWVFWVAANLLLSWYFAFFVNLIPVVAKEAVEILWGEVSESTKSSLELYASAKDAIKPMLYGATAYASWVIIFDSIYHLYDTRDESLSRATYTPRAYQAVQFLFFLLLVLSAEKMLKHMIAFAFHKKAFQDRIDTLSNDLKVLDHLRQYKPRRRRPAKHATPGHRTPILSALGWAPLADKSPIPASTPLHSEQVYKGSGEDIPERHHADTLQVAPRFWQRRTKSGGVAQLKNARVTPPSVTVTPDKPASPHGRERLSPPTSHQQTPSRHSSPERSRPGTPHSRLSRNHDDEDTVAAATRVLKATILHDARNLKGKDDLTDQAALAWTVSSAYEAKQVAKALYRSFRGDHRRKYLIPSDFYPAYATREAAEEAFKVFDKDGNGDISRAEIKNTVLKVYKERRFLSRSLRDVGHALKTLDLLMITLALVILFFISLSIFRVSLGASLTSVYTLAVGASFIFKNSASNMFDAVMFLFVTHPFDTGDRVFIDDENMVVKKTGLFATTLQRVDGTTSYYFNSQLFGKFITNIRRSGKQAEGINLQVSWRTPMEKLDQLAKCMNEWLQTEENRWFEPSTGCTLQHIDFQKSLEVTLGISHNGNWQDWGLRNARKTAFCAAAQFYCRQLGIVCYNSPRPIAFTKHPKEFNMASGLDADVDPELPLSNFQSQDTEVKAALGFLPPLAMREEMRARKRKGNGKGSLKSVTPSIPAGDSL